jgi:hypothetical protein
MADDLWRKAPSRVGEELDVIINPDWPCHLASGRDQKPINASGLILPLQASPKHRPRISVKTSKSQYCCR